MLHCVLAETRSWPEALQAPDPWELAVKATELVQLGRAAL